MIECYWLFFLQFVSRMIWPVASVLLLLSSAVCTAQTFNQEVALQQAVLKRYEKQIRSRIEIHQPIASMISKQLNQNALPKQLVLLPMLESSYDAEALSPAGARGLWQLMPATAERYGLSTKPQDQRLNINASTKAALSYLKFLYKKFNQNLTLTLAAYNAGEGRVTRAIKQAGSKDFHKLRLPKETRQYVHRFYALVNLINVTSLGIDTFQPFMLFSPDVTPTRQPLVNLTPLPPLVEL